MRNEQERRVVTSLHPTQYTMQFVS